MKNLLKKDFTYKWYIFLGIAFCAIRLLLCCTQMVYIVPQEAPIDDMLMFRAAQSIVNGNWLGEYGWLTISKHMFFALWLAFLNVCHIPYLIGGHLLYIGACIALVAAFTPVLKKNYARLILLCFLLYNPVSWAEYNVRIYRDNIFPALCMLCFAGIIGVCLRVNLPFKKNIGFAIIGGIGFGTAYLTREDGIWLLPFVLCALAFYVFCVFNLKEKLSQKFLKSALALIPFSILGAFAIVFCSLNFAYYGRFVVSDFTSKDFNCAIGAFSRADDTGAHRGVFVPYETRKEIYEKVPTAKKLGETLETDGYYGSFGNIKTKEFGGGGFYWALRSAAESAGLTPDAVTAKNFYQTLGDDINHACDSGAIKTENSKINSTMMPFQPEYILPTLKEMASSFKTLFLFEQTNPFSTKLCVFAKETEQIDEIESFLHTKCTIAAQANTDLPYLSPLQNIFSKVLNIITFLFRILAFPCGIFAIIYLFSCIKTFFDGFKTKLFSVKFMGSVVYIGVFASFIMRVAMISYVEAVAFNIGTYLMYLSSAAPLMLILFAIGSLKLLEKFREK